MRIRAGVALLSLFVLDCAMKPEERYDKMRGMLEQAKYDDAAKFIESGKEKFYGESNAVLYYLDELMALHLAKRYQESNALVDKATKRMDDLYTTSVSTEVGAFMTNDNAKPYEGEDFERALIHVVGALNYSALGQRDDALVEARRVEQQLQVLNDAHSKVKEGKKSEYAEDAFVRWLAGSLYESDGSDEGLNDAWVSYQKALQAYEKAYLPKYRTTVPSVLVQDALRVAERLGFDDEYKAIKRSYPQVSYPRQAEVAAQGSLVFLHLNGEAPYKVEKSWNAIADGKAIRVAYPEFMSKPKRVAYAVITVAGQTGRTELMENVNAIAIQNLKDHMSRIKGKMIARAIAKFVAAKATEVASTQASGNQTFGALMGAAASVAGAVTERADIRSWLLLPSSIDASRMYLAPGTYTATVEFFGMGGGALAKKTLPSFTVEKGRTTFLSYRTF